MALVAVIDIGKTNAKVLLIDGATGRELAAERAPNSVCAGPPFPHHDVEALFGFVVGAMKTLGAERGIDVISITTHGASAVLVKADGTLALPMLDYEYGGPDAVRVDYEKLRPPFAESGSPALPVGLNVGAQLFWLQRRFPEAFTAARWVLTYPQYWSFRLTGVASVEPTSLGCHTDLWNPWRGDFSSLVDRMGWRAKFPPVRAAGDVAALRPEIAAATGLSPVTPVTSGIHDSNASLLPNLSSETPPFAVVSTGTWIIAFAVGGRSVALDATRDTLVNVNAHGAPTSTARFMGGRALELLCGGPPAACSTADADAVLQRRIMALPSVVEGSGPFPDAAFHWAGEAPATPGQMSAAASFHCALMTAVCLDLIGAEGQIWVDGPFAANRLFLTMLACATGRAVCWQHGTTSGPAQGAAMLVARPTPGLSGFSSLAPGPEAGALQAYAEAWRALAGA